MKAVGKSVVGNVRKNNEDSIFIDEEGGLFIVADGMGGHQGGEVASKLAVDSFLEYYNKKADEGIDFEDVGDVLAEGISYANNKVVELSMSENHLLGMGTTFTCAIINKGKMVIAHVGDSRAYLFNGENLKQLTKDHSYVMEMMKYGELTEEEAENHPQKNVITRAIGSPSGVKADVMYHSLRENCYILICSDGLTNMVKSDQLLSIFKEELELTELVEKLITKANENGGKDNISAITVRYEVNE